MEGKLIIKNDQKASYLNQIKAEAERKRKKLKSSGISRRRDNINNENSKDKKTFKHTELNSTIYSQTALTPIHKETERINLAMDLEAMAQEEFGKMLKIFRDIEFAHGKAIHMLFGYKLLDLKREEGKQLNSFRFIILI